VEGSPARISRRRMLALTAGAVAASGQALHRASAGEADPIRFALTPVLLTNDLDLLDKLRLALEVVTETPVQIVTRRTYQEITTLLVSGQVDGAWICSPPFITYRRQLELLAVPVWNGRPFYQSYLIADTGRNATSIEALAGDIHAFSDPDSNSGYLVTAAELAGMGYKPERFFRQVFFTYGHRNVVRAVASGLARSGSVDGYVYEVLRAVEPALVDATRVVRRSDWFGFPPVACPAAAVGTERTEKLRRALLSMHESELGRAALAALRIDAFSAQPAALFDPVAANLALVRGLG
jgi:phosphonate transport system substrate-binding protein